MDQEELTMDDALWGRLTDSEKEQWQHIQNLVGTVGWKLVERDLKQSVETLQESIFHVPNWDEYVFAKGKLVAFTDVLSLEQKTLHLLTQRVADRHQEEEEQLDLPNIPEEPFS